jgi:hypothetical protein
MPLVKVERLLLEELNTVLPGCQLFLGDIDRVILVSGFFGSWMRSSTTGTYCQQEGKDAPDSGVICSLSCLAITASVIAKRSLDLTARSCAHVVEQSSQLTSMQSRSRQRVFISRLFCFLCLIHIMDVRRHSRFQLTPGPGPGAPLSNSQW